MCFRCSVIDVYIDFRFSEACLLKTTYFSVISCRSLYFDVIYFVLNLRVLSALDFVLDHFTRTILLVDFSIVDVYKYVKPISQLGD